MTGALLRIIYLSHSRHNLDEDELLCLLQVSRRNNQWARITGALAYHRQTFLQVLEGPPAALDDLMVRITLDGRHDTPIVLDRTPISERQFGGWSMGWITSRSLELAGYDPGILNMRGGPSIEVNSLLDAFRTVARVN